jgi:hypothetical protein
MPICELQSRLMGGKPFTLVATYPHARNPSIYSKKFQFQDGILSCQTYYFDDSGSNRKFYILQKVSSPKKLNVSKLEKMFSDLKSKSVFKFIDFKEGNEPSLKPVFHEHIHHFNADCPIYIHLKI